VAATTQVGVAGGPVSHDDRACCPCGGCSDKLDGEQFEMTTCELHPAVRCEHWLEVFRKAGRIS
jgi:hypothetical protein